MNTLTLFNPRRNVWFVAYYILSTFSVQKIKVANKILSRDSNYILDLFM